MVQHYYELSIIRPTGTSKSLQCRFTRVSRLSF